MTAKPLPGLWRRRAVTLAVAAVGAGVFWALHLPLPLLMGPMTACLIAALARAQLADMGAFGTYLRTFLGLAVGASITPDLVHKLPAMAGSLAFVPLFILAIACMGYPLFRRVFGFDHPTAWYAAMPGGLQDMLVFGAEAGGDLRALSLIHATRVLAIVTLAPILMHWLWAVDLTQAPGQPASSVGAEQIVILLVAGLVGWKAAERLGLFGASILGPMILAAILSLTGVIHARPPSEMIWAAQLFIGLSVGVKYTGITLREIRIDVGAGLLYAALLALLSLGFIELITQTGLAPGQEAFLAFLPGGQAEMVVIAIMTGADLAFVVSHHLLRLILVILLAPVVAKLVLRRGG
ncbi:AbrB family transcriptional regulator [Xinfangfangia pollutisoli]|uniref:AbrB family transcriptional regulator n=1 Tax=Xinfangfangia pollutisoli TaxID=2865960 RepID=UPI001CD29EA8|nr:AbrB family transcriptional regulator [Xinfangfangia pollutisoli]